MSHSIRTIEDLEHQRFGAMISGDAETLEALLSESLTYTHSHGGTDTKTVFLNNVRNGPVRYHSMTNHSSWTFGTRRCGFTAKPDGSSKLGNRPVSRDVALGYGAGCAFGR